MAEALAGPTGPPGTHCVALHQQDSRQYAKERSEAEPYSPKPLLLSKPSMPPERREWLLRSKAGTRASELRAGARKS